MTLQELIDKVPLQFQPVATKYGPALIAMTAQEFADWLDMLINGKTMDAWRAVTAKLSNADLVAAWSDVKENWEAANEKNADRIALQRAAAMAVLKVLLAASLAMVGL